MSHIWEDIEGYEGFYEVSNKGEVRSQYRTKRTLKGRDNGKGYHKVALYKDGKRKDMYVHRLVCLAFLDLEKDFTEINHIDFDRCNNNVDNLEYVDRQTNMRKSVEAGRMAKGEKSGASKLTDEQVIFIRDVKCYKHKAIAVMFSIDDSHVSRIRAGKVWRHL